MKPFILFSNGLVFSLCFFPFCSSLQKQTGSISRQVDLIEDLAVKLPENDRPRFLKALENIRKEEKEKDSVLIDAIEETKKSIGEAMESKEDSGKWYGIRNLAVFLGLAAIAFLALRFGKVI